MDIAYSLEFQKVIDAERAYDLFQSDIIEDKRAFECPNEECSSQITCVNIDRPVQEIKKSVHYRNYGLHVENCSYGSKKTIKDSNTNLVELNNNKLDNIHILTDRPKDYYTVKNIINLSIEDREDEKKIRKREYLQKNDLKRQKKHYWIAPLVTNYLKNIDNGETLKKTFIQMKNDKKISFSDFFVSIQSQNFNTISKYPKVYFGKAFFNKKTDDSIEIKFAEPFRLDGELKKPALKLDLNSVSSYKNYSYWKKRLDTVIKSKRPYLFFIYGVPSVNEWEKDDQLIKFIRFKTKKLDYMDLRIL